MSVGEIGEGLEDPVEFDHVQQNDQSTVGGDGISGELYLEGEGGTVYHNATRSVMLAQLYSSLKLV